MTDIAHIANGQSMKNIREDILNPLIDVVNTQIPANATAIQSAVASATHATELAQTAQQEATSAGTKADAAKTESAAAKQAVEEVKTNYLEGIHIEDEHNHVVDKAKRVILVGVEVEQSEEGTAVIRAQEAITASPEAGDVGTKTKGNYLAFPGATVELGTDGKAVVITFPPGSHTIVVSDKAGNEYNATKLSFPTASIFEGADEGTYVIDTGLGVSETGGQQIQNVTEFEFDTCTVEDITAQGEPTRKIRVTPDFATVEQKASPAYLAFFGNPEYVDVALGPQAVHGRNIVYPEEIVADSNNPAKINPDKDSQTITLNKLDGFTDTSYLVSVRLAFRGKAYSNGFIRLSLEDENGPVMDTYGIPMSIEHNYKTGDYLEAIQLTSILDVDNAVSFQIICETDLQVVQPVITPRNEAPSGILVQSLTYLSKTSDAMQQWEQEVGEKFPLSLRSFGGEVFNFKYLTEPARGPYVAGAPSAKLRSDGYVFHSINGFNWQVVDNTFSMWNKEGADIDSSFARIFDATSTRFMRGHRLSSSIEIANDLAWSMALLKWTGAPDKADTELFSGRPFNGTPTWKPGWSVVDEMILPSGNQDVFSTYGDEFDIPNDAVQIAIVLYPVNPSLPAYMKFRSFKGNLETSVEGWVLGMQQTVGEPSTRKVNDLVTYVQDNQGTAGVEYPISTSESPIPFGKLLTGGDVAPAPSVNPVTTVAQNQRDGEGGVEFVAEGVLEFSPTQLLIVNKGTTQKTVTFKYKVKHSDGTTEDLTDSSTVFTVRGQNGSGQFFRMKSFKYHCRHNDVLYLVATSSDDSSLVLAGLNASMPMVKGSLVYKKILPSSYDTPASTPYAFGVAQIDTTDQKYAPVTANVTATVPLNTLFTSDAVAAASVTFDNSNDTVKVATTGLMKIDYKAHIIRTQQWNAAVKYALWVEKSENNGVTWTKVDGSVSRVNIPADYPATAIPLTVTFPTRVTVAGTMFRIRHITDTIVNGIGLQSYAASGDFPAVASIQLTGTFI